MPLGLVSDIHGNDRALAAVVEELERLGVEGAVCLGDAVQGGDEPRQVLDRLAELGWPVVLGNADDFLLEVQADSPEPITEAQLEKRAWTLEQLDASHLEQIRSFQRTIEIGSLLAFHGSPRSYDDVLLPETQDDTAWRVPGFDVLAGGHTHRQWTRGHGRRAVREPGRGHVGSRGVRRTHGSIGRVPAMRVLTLRELNRATLARQLLLERKLLSPTVALERVAGLQAQWAPAPYVGLWTRTEGFRREALEKALLTRRIVRAVLMRGTIHLVSARDYATFSTAVEAPPWANGVEFAEGIHDAARTLCMTPRTRAEIAATVNLPLEDRAWYVLRTQARLAHAPESGFWKAKGVTRYVTVEHEPGDPAAARVELVRRYLAAFGPATRADVGVRSGLRAGDVASALDALEPLRRFRDEQGRELLDLPRAPLPPADTPAPVRLIPRFDNLLLSHKDRTRVIADEHRPLVIDGGWVKSTLLADGFVAGTWAVENGRVRIEPFEPLPRAVRREADDEAARLEAWLR